MERVFTKDHGRYRAGETRDWSYLTWSRFFPGYEKYTQPVTEVVASAFSTADVIPITRKKVKRHDASDG